MPILFAKSVEQRRDKMTQKPGQEIIHDSQRVVTIPERIEALISEALSGTSPRSKRTILTEAKELVGDLK